MQSIAQVGKALLLAIAALALTASLSYVVYNVIEPPCRDSDYARSAY